MWIDKSPYWFSKEAIAKVEKLKNATHMGYWCLRNKFGNWDEAPVDIFYVEKPDTSKGHSHYFGLFRVLGNILILKGDSAFSEPITGVLGDNDEVIVSRYRHDYQNRKGVMVDGGRDYLRHSQGATLVQVAVDGCNFKFKKD